MRNHLSSLLKISVSVVGFIIVIARMDLRQIWAVLIEINWFWAILALALILFSLFLRAYRWQLLLRGLGADISFKRLANLYFVGNFFNAFLPSGFGGDVVRVVEASRNIPASEAAGTVLVDRLTGLLMLFALGFLALPFRPDSFRPEETWLVAAISVFGLVAGFILLEGSLLRQFGGWLPSKWSPTGDGPVAKVLQAVQGCGWTAVVQALAVSIVFNLILAGWWWISGFALGFQLSYKYYLLVIPILSVSALVPSIGGLGVRENIAPFLFAPAGLTGEEAAALSFLIFFLMRIASLLGAPVYIYSLLHRSN